VDWRTQLEPGEIIEIQRGGVKAKFQVHWMGLPGTELEDQAGIRELDPGKSIWSPHLPADQTDIAVDRGFFVRQRQRTVPRLVPAPNKPTTCAMSAALAQRCERRVLATPFECRSKPFIWAELKWIALPPCH